MKRKIILTESQLIDLIKTVINEQVGAMMSTTKGVGRLNLSKAPRMTGGKRLGFPEDSPIDDVPCELEPLERIEICFKTAKTYPSSSSDILLANKLGPKMEEEMTGLGHGNVLNRIDEIKTKGQLKAIIDWFDKNSEYSLYEWISDEIVLNKQEVVNKLQSKGFYLPYCRKGCECPIS